MADNEFDLTVIGSGPGGYVAAIRAAQLGFRTCCVEKEKTLGGTCLNVGCIPSKTLLQTTEHYDFINREASKHGIQVDKVSLDFDAMMKRKKEVVKGLVDSIEGLFKRNGIVWKKGAAKLVSPTEVEIAGETGTERVKSKYILLATGSESIALPFLEIDEKRVVTSTGALDLKTIPKKMVVIGAGVIGVELASVYRRLGSEVHIVEMLDRICPTMDAAIGKGLLQILKKQGLNFYLNSKVVKAEKGEKEILLTISTHDKDVALSADVVMVAIGRKPYIKGLGLQEVGVGVDERGFVLVDDNFKTNVDNIYAIGDIIEGPMLAHKASEEGIVAVEALAGHPSKINYISIPNIVYTHPEVAAVGLTEQEGQSFGFKMKTGTVYFKGNARARCSGETDGLVKIIGDAESGRLLGLHIIGSNASEMIQEGVIALNQNATLEDIAHASHGHPTRTEAVKEAALLALGKAIHV